MSSSKTKPVAPGVRVQFMYRAADRVGTVAAVLGTLAVVVLDDHTVVNVDASMLDVIA